MKTTPEPETSPLHQDWRAERESLLEQKRRDTTQSFVALAVVMHTETDRDFVLADTDRETERGSLGLKNERCRGVD
jgi:hypothetical protein